MSNLLNKIADDESQLIEKSMKNLFSKGVELQNFIGHLNLKLYKKYQFYNFYDILIALSLNHLIRLIQ